MAGNTSPATSVSAPDTTAPAPISAGSLIVSEDGKTVSGSGEPGSTVSVKDAGGKEIGTATVGKDGKFSATLDQPKTGGEVLSVTQTDMAGNTSPATSVSAPEMRSPAVTDLAVSGEGTTLSGSGTPGNIVNVKDANGREIGSATIDQSGKFSLPLHPALTNGEVLKVTQSTTEGHISPVTEVRAPDTTAPEPAINLSLSGEGDTLYGNGEVGNTATVTRPDGTVLGTAKVDANGRFSVTLTPAQSNGETLTVTLRDQAGNQSRPMEIKAQDTTAPTAATDLAISEKGAVLTGQGEAGSLVRVTGEGGKILGTGNVDADGRFTVTLTPAQANGENLSVTLTDAASNISLAADFIAPDITPPASVTDLIVTDHVGPTQGKLASGSYTDDHTPTLSGTAEANSTITLYDGKNILGTVKADSDGKWSYTPDSLDIGQHSLSVTVSDAAGNVSAPSAVVEIIVSDIFAVDDKSSLTLSSIPVITDKGQSKIDIVSLPSVKLFDGNLLNLSLLDSSKYSYAKASVPDGSVTTITLQAILAGAAALTTYDLMVYRSTDKGATFSLFNVEKNWMTNLALFAKSAPLTLALPEGEYKFIVANTNGVSLLSNINLSILSEKNWSLDTIESSISGNVIHGDQNGAGSDKVTQDTVVSAVGDTAIAGQTTIQGKWGSLVMDAQGNYTYILKSGIGAESIIDKSEVFTYKLASDNGSKSSATLTIDLNTYALRAYDDMVSLPASAVSATTAYDSGVLMTLNQTALIAGNSAQSATFSVAEGTVLTNAVLTFKTALQLLASTSVNYTLTDSHGTVIKQGATSKTSVDLSDINLTSGAYTLNISTKTSGLLSLGALSVSIQGKSVEVGDFHTGNSTSVSGNIFDGSESENIKADQLVSTTTTLTINGADGRSTTLNAYSNVADMTSATVKGQYGTLDIKLDGTYTYTLTANTSLSSLTSKEHFTYTLTAADGTTSTAILVIDLKPQITGSNFGDVLNSTVYNDAFTLKAGADTLVYKVLNGADATGGNGSDTWNDFSLAGGDRINLVNLLIGWDGTSASLSNYLSVSHVDSNTIIAVDRDGTGAAFSSTPLLTLTGVNLTLDDLLQMQSSMVALPAASGLALTDDGLTLTGHGEPGTTVSIASANGSQLGSARVGNDGNFSVSLSRAQLNGETVSVRLDDGAGNVSAAAKLLSADITPPDAITDLTIADNQGSSQGTVLSEGFTDDTTPVLSGTSEANSTVALYDGGTLLGTTMADDDGKWSYTPDALSIGRHSLMATSTDTAGNTSSASKPVLINISDVVAVNDKATLSVTTAPEVTTKTLNTSQTLMNSASVKLGSVLDLSLLTSTETANANNSRALAYNVAEGTTSTVTLQSGSLGLTLLSSSDLYTYRSVDGGKTFTQYAVEFDWLKVLVLGATSSKLSLTLPEGEYRFLMASKGGVEVLNGVTLKLLSETNWILKTTETSVTGNVISGDSDGTGADTVSSGTLVKSVNGTDVSTDGITSIAGTYGVLNIDAEGKYTYTLKSGLSSVNVVGKQESFTYTLAAEDGSAGRATLIITLPAAALQAYDDHVKLHADVTPETGKYDSGTLLSLGLGNQSSLGKASFTVPDGKVMTDVSLKMAVAGVAGGTSSLSYTITDSAGHVVYTGSSSPKSTAPISLEGLSLKSGTYTLEAISRTPGYGLLKMSLNGNTVQVDHYHTLDSTRVIGNIFNGDHSSAHHADQLVDTDTTLTVTGSDRTSSILNVDNSTSDSAIVKGHYGTLDISIDGSYTYTLNANLNIADIRSKETFDYTLTAKNGITSTATLTIDLETHITGSKFDDSVTSTAYGNIFTLKSGADTLVYNLLNASDATGGNGTDTWTDFSVSDGDKIDISNLLVGWNGSSDTLGNFVSVSEENGKTMVSIDRDGTGSDYSSTQLITLEGVSSVTLDELLRQPAAHHNA